MSDKKVVTWRALVEELGWWKSRTQTQRDMDKGRFPKCLRPPGAHCNTHRVWLRSKIEEHLSNLTDTKVKRSKKGATPLIKES